MQIKSRKDIKVRKKGLLVLAVSVALLAAGCSKKVENVDTTAATEETTATESQEETTQEPVQVPEITTTPEDMRKLAGEQVTLGQYTGVEYSKQDASVSDDDVELQISQILSQNPLVEEITGRAVADGDKVNIDFVGKKDGVAFEGGTAEKFDLVIGSNSFIDGFESGLIGANVGDEVKLNLTFPENYDNPELKGQEVEFTVTINGIKKETPAEAFDDAFVARVSTDYKTADEYRAAITEDLKLRNEQDAQNKQKNEVFSKVVKACQVGTLPQDRVDYQAFYNKYQQQYQAAMYGMKLEDMLSLYGMTMEQFEQECREKAELYVKQDMIVYAIANQENIQVSDEDLNTLAKAYEFNTAEEMYAQYDKDDVYEAALFDNVVQFLMANAKEVEAAAE